MLLHELNLGSLCADAQTMEPACQLALDANFGSLQRWHDDVVAIAKGMVLAGSSGWVLLVFQPHEGTLANQWAGDDTQVPTGCVPILALSLVEQAQHLNSQAAAGAAVDAFRAHINWAAVYTRYQAAVQTASEPHGVTAEELGAAPVAPLVLDVRRAAVVAKADTMLPAARWRDPVATAQWAAELPVDQDVVVYCVHGHEVSRAAALRLRAAGLNARFLRGGIAGWLAAGRPAQIKQAGLVLNGGAGP